MIKLNTNWSILGQDAATTSKVEELKSYLDNRLSVMKEATQSDVDRILVSFLSYGTNEFQVSMESIPEKDKELVAVCRDALLGNLLQRTKGRNCYQVREDQKGWYATTTIDKDSKFRIMTTYGAAIQDGSYHDLPIEQIKTLNYFPITTVTVIKPNLQTHWCVSDEGPKGMWNNVEGEELPDNGLFTQIRDQAVADNYMTLAPYRYDTIICRNGNQACLSLRIATAKITGKLFNYSVSFKNQWGTTGVSWGSRG